MRKYLILTVTAGEGHNSMARTIKEKLEEDPNNEVRVIDIFKKYGKPGKTTFINDGYNSACKYALPIYNIVFRNMQQADPDKKNKTIAQSWLDHETPQLINDILLFQPDVILSTHFYGGIMITNLRKKFDIPAKAVNILTDYTVHPFHECATDIDYLITPAEDLHEQLLFKGYRTEQLLPLGIPVKEKFSTFITKTDARKELGIDTEMFTVFVSIGGGGFGRSDKILKKLLKIEQPIQIIIVNGRNAQAYEKIESILNTTETQHKIINYGFATNTEIIMSACDCIVGKCGVTILNEALNKCKVMILSDKLPQQEYDNMVYLSSHNACIRVSKYFPVELIVDHLRNNPEILDKFEKNIIKIRKDHALNDICKFISALPSAHYPNSTHLLSDKEIKQVRSELKKLKSDEDFLIKEDKKKRKKLEKILKDKDEIKTEKREEKERREKYKTAVRQTKSTIYTDDSILIDPTPEMLGVDKLKKR